METRKIVIYQTKNQTKTTIMTDATTLSELKAACAQNGIEYDGMTWFEGTSKTELRSDDSILPHDVPYKGTVTNELVFMLTNTNKKIRSGAMTRIEAYTAIKAANLQDVVKEELGKNFTMCKTSDLIAIVERYTKPTTVVEEPSAPVVEQPEEVNSTEVVDIIARKAIKEILDLLDNQTSIDVDDIQEVRDLFDAPEKSSFAAETEDMFGDWIH